MTAKPCGHPPHPEDGNLGFIPVGGSIRIEHGEAVEAHRDDPKWFVGKNCKLGFPVLNDARERKEYMWVQVLDLGKETKELVGRLANTPVMPSEFSHGSLLSFETSEIVDVDDPS